MIVNRPWRNDGLDAALDSLRVLKPPAGLDLALAYLRPLRGRAEEHVQAMTAFADGLVPALTELRERGRARETEDGEAADLLALLGRTLIVRAWQVRGSGPAATVSRDSFDTFGSLLAESDDVLVAALERVPHHPAAATFRLTTARGLGATSDEWWARFETARRERGTLFPAHVDMMNGLCRKWYGSDERMFEFARSVAAKAPAGDPVSAILPLAHAEYLCSLRMSGRPAKGPSARRLLAREWRADVDAVAAASRRWCGDGTGPVPAHPADVTAHNLFGWFLGVSRRHRDQGRWHLQQAAGRMTGPPWSYLPPSAILAFENLHAKLGIG